MTGRWFLEELAEELGEIPRFYSSDLFKQCVNKLLEKPQMLIIDEIDYLASDQKAIESNIALFMDGSDLYLDYGATVDTDQTMVYGQSTNTVERVEVGGYYLTDSTINQAIQDMSAYATANSISFTSVEDVKASAELMTIIANSWQAVYS